MSKQHWFSSDWHLNHANILRYDNRPFIDINEMNDIIINSYNSVVSDEDDFYFLGDFNFGSGASTEWALSQLKGNKFFIKGNHDNKDVIRAYRRHGQYLGYGSDEIRINGQKITICHYAHRVWNGNARGNIMLYGHSHGSLEKEEYGKSMDVGIMTSYKLFNNWEPLNFQDQIMPIMNKREIKAVDHHIRKENFERR